MRVAYQAGVLTALEQADLRFHHVDGASGGTINLSMLLSGQNSAEMSERWRTLDPRYFSALLPWRNYLRTLRWPGLGSGRGIRDKVFPHLGVDPDQIRRSTGIAGTYNVCNFATKMSEVVEHTEVDLDILVAAVSLPILMPAVMKADTAYTDALWIRDSNIPEAVSRGSNDVWLVWCIGNTPKYQNGSFRQYVHMIEMAANGSLLRDLDYVEARWPKRPVRVHVIKPEHPIPLDPDYYLGRIDAAPLIDLGYQDACRYLADPHPLSAPWDASPTQMTEGVPGATTRLILRGPFALGEYSPAQGAEKGRQLGAVATLHLQLQARGPNPPGVPNLLSVAGDLSLPGQSPYSLIENGTARLDNTGLTIDLTTRYFGRLQSLMVEPTSSQSMAITLSGGDHRVAVLGAGVVTLGWRQAARALTTIHSTNNASSTEARRARISLGCSLLRATLAPRIDEAATT